MGASISNGNSRKKKRGRRSQQPMSEINVTPFVDVMLVLLIIFMITAPLMTVGVPIELPKTKAKQIQGDKEPLTITINVKGEIFLQETEIKIDEIVPKLTAITKGGYSERIYVRGDQRASYGTVMKIMGALNKAGFLRIALVTGIEDS